MGWLTGGLKKAGNPEHSTSAPGSSNNEGIEIP